MRKAKVKFEVGQKVRFVFRKYGRYELVGILEEFTKIDYLNPDAPLWASIRVAEFHGLKDLLMAVPPKDVLEVVQGEACAS